MSTNKIASNGKNLLIKIVFLGFNFVRLVAGYVSPVSVVMPSKLLGAIIVAMSPKIFGNSATFFLTDYQILENQGLDFGVLPIGN